MAARQRQNGHSSMRSTEEYLKNKIGFRSPEIEKNFPALEKKPTRTHARVGSNKTNI
jgi:hypothetical protein